MTDVAQLLEDEKFEIGVCDIDDEQLLIERVDTTVELS